MTKRSDFVRCYDDGNRFFSRSFVFFVLERAEAAAPWRLGMAVTKKSGTAVWRNRLRRLIRECIRLVGDSTRPGYDFVVVPKKHVDPRMLSQADVNAELLRLLEKATLLKV